MPSCECGCGAIVRNRFKRGHNAVVQKNAEKPLADRLKKYEIDPETGCWNWTGALTKKGYGRISTRAKNQWDRVYKVMWEFVHGPVPEGAHLHHACENPRCVRPDENHVTPVTPAWHLNHHINERG